MSRPADRQRIYRRRVAAGKIILKIEVDEVSTVEALVLHGFLAADAVDDRRAIAAALSHMIDLLIASRYA